MKKIFIALTIFAFLLNNCAQQTKKNHDAHDVIETMMASGRYSDAIQEINSEINKNKNNMFLYYQRGHCYLALKEIDNAQNDFATCLSIKQNFDLGLYGMAIIYTEKQYYDLAKKNLYQVIKITKNNSIKALAHNNLSIIYKKTNNYPKAITAAIQAIKYDDRGVYYLQLGTIYYINGNPEQAKQTWIDAINKNNFLAKTYKHQTYSSLAECYYHEKKYEQAKRSIEKAISLDPTNQLYLDFYKKINQTLK